MRIFAEKWCPGKKFTFSSGEYFTGFWDGWEKEDEEAVDGSRKLKGIFWETWTIELNKKLRHNLKGCLCTNILEFYNEIFY